MSADLSQLPSVDILLQASDDLIEQFGRQLLTDYFRTALAELRKELLSDQNRQTATEPNKANFVRQLKNTAKTELQSRHTSSLQSVINLTGTVLHTNLGRAPLPKAAIDAVVKVAASYSNLEFNLHEGRRGDRDSHVEQLLIDITGAEAATIVNNNAAAVLLCLSSLAKGKQVPVSRGELVEIGGSFRIPEVMRSSGCELVEIGATNRTHLKDYQSAITSETALLLKVHTSNYEIKGFTHAVSDAEVAELAHQHGLPAMTDLGSGSLVDLSQWGLPKEPTVQSAIEQGLDIVTFSGDKLLGGPQCGIIVGKKTYIDKIKQNPLKRALRVDKMTMAALAEVLRLYQVSDQLRSDLPALRYLTRDLDEIHRLALEVSGPLANLLGPEIEVSICAVHSQIGSGSLPLDLLPSHAIKLIPEAGSDKALKALSEQLRGLSVPVIGRLNDGALYLDLRTLDTADQLLDQVKHLS